MKKQLLFLSLGILLLFSFTVYAQAKVGRSDFGTDDAPQASGIMVNSGGTNACSDVTGSHVCGYEAPGYTTYVSYDATGATLVKYYVWIDYQGKMRISSGSDGDSSTGYGIPTDASFDIESSGVLVGTQN